MPRGKKFDAAEKHFMKKEERYKAELKILKESNEAREKALDEARDHIDKLETENASLKEWIERLLEYTELTPEEIKAKIKADRQAGEALELLNRLPAIARMFGSYTG